MHEPGCACNAPAGTAFIWLFMVPPPPPHPVLDRSFNQRVHACGQCQPIGIIKKERSFSKSLFDTVSQASPLPPVEP
jgi:hypothetical protein